MIRSTFEALIKGLNAFGQRIDEFYASIQRRRPIEALGQKCGMEIVDAHGCHHTGKTGEYHCHGPAYVGVASVIDGDTIEIHGQHFRISGIDAPEAKQLCNDVKGKAYRSGQLAVNALAALIGPQIVS